MDISHCVCCHSLHGRNSRVYIRLVVNIRLPTFLWYAIAGCMYVDSVGRRDLLLLSLAGMGVTAFVCAWMIHIGHLDPLSAVPSDETGSAMQWSSESSFATYLTRYFYGGSILLYCYCSFMSIGRACIPSHLHVLILLVHCHYACGLTATCSVIIPVEMFPLRARSRALALSTACYYTSRLIWIANWLCFELFLQL